MGNNAYRILVNWLRVVSNKALQAAINIKALDVDKL
jgi:hypothetical protein